MSRLANQIPRKAPLMAPMKMRFWPFFASIGLALAANAAGHSSQHAEHESAGGFPATEWMRGVPKGCRVVSFDICDRDSHRFDRKDRVDFVWEYVSATDRHATTVLIDNVVVLNAERQGDQAFLRATVALTPCQAGRLKVAAACGTLRISETSSSSQPSDVSLPAWSIHGINDRTEAIEAYLVSCSEVPESLERPTLAAESGGSSRSSRRVITVPVQLDLQR
jgi:hypothetical protein